jgi:hypothetical protein
MSEIRRQCRDLRRENRGERMRIFGAVHAQHRFHAENGGGLRGHCRGVRPQQDDGDVGVRNGLGAGDAFRGRRIQRLAVVLADDEYLVH